MSDAPANKNRNSARPRTHAGAQALVRAVESGDAAEVRRLLGVGAAAEVPLAGGETALMRAAAKGFEDVARVLLEGGADVNARREDGFTPLLVAAFHGQAGVARLLLESGADKSARTRLGSTAEKWAASHGLRELAAMLKPAAPAGTHAQTPGVLTGKAIHPSKIDDNPAPENEAPPREPAAIPPVSPAVAAARYRVALPVALALIVVAGVALYAFVWRSKTPVSSQQPAPPAGGATNVTALPALPAQVAAPTAQPTPTVLPPDAQAVPGAQGATNYPTVIIVPADTPVPGSNTSTRQSGVPSSTVPSVVSEGGAQATAGKTPRPGATDAAVAGKEAGRQDDGARTGDDAERGAQVRGAEIRTAAPSRPSSQPPPALSTQPAPSPTPKKKVIQWP